MFSYVTRLMYLKFSVLHEGRSVVKLFSILARSPAVYFFWPSNV